MDVNEYMDMVRSKNPQILSAEKLRISSAELEKAMRHAFEAGRESHEADSPGTRMFNQLFGD